MRPLTPAVARQAKGTPRSVREQQPTTHQVTITDDGFIWNGGTLVACQASLAASPGQRRMGHATLFRRSP